MTDAAASSNPLHPDEIQGILNGSADDIGAPNDGYDNSYGNGLLNAGAAVARLRAPYTLNRFATSGGTAQPWSDVYTVPIYTHQWQYTGNYFVRRVPVRKTVQFNTTYASPPKVFGRGVNASTGWGDYPYSIFNSGFCRVISNTATSAELETFVYYVWNASGQDLGYIPYQPQSATFAYSVLGVPADTTAPAPVTNLAASSGARTESAVSWMAPGDDGSTGQAHHFDLRRSTSPITSGNFSQATPVTAGVPTPGPAGTQHCMIDENLNSCITYYYAIKTVDEAGNTSLISNFPSATTACSGYSFAVCDEGGLAGGGGEEGLRTGQLEPSGTSDGLPVDFSLGVQTPNPGAGHMSMQYALPRPGPVRIDVYSVDGRLMKSLVDASEHPAGTFDVRWDGRMTSGASVPSGMYFYRMRAGEVVRETRGLVLK